MEGFSRSLAYCQPKKNEIWRMSSTHMFLSKIQCKQKSSLFWCCQSAFLVGWISFLVAPWFYPFFQTCITVFTPEKLPYLTTHHWLFDAVFFCPIPWENIYQTDILFSLAPLVDSHEYKSLWIKVLGKHFNSYIMNTFWVSEFRR